MQYDYPPNELGGTLGTRMIEDTSPTTEIYHYECKSTQIVFDCGKGRIFVVRALRKHDMGLVTQNIPITVREAWEYLDETDLWQCEYVPEKSSPCMNY